MLITTTPGLPDGDYEVIGLVRGTSIRSRSVVQDFVEWLRNLVGAELTHYTKMMAETREQALDRMIEQARQQGADAVVGVRFATTSIVRGAAELLVYGTAVRKKK
jgi:uncharacterized protein YbjQ (UPF0145 family)